jgi:acyl transferase domain-containing protein
MHYLDKLESMSRAQLMALAARQHQQATGPIAIIGMGCRLPGEVDDPWQLWTAVRDGRVASALGHPPPDSLGRPRWNTDAPDLKAHASLLSKGAYLSDVDVFDAKYFRGPAADAPHIDPQQRILLEVSLRALADANLTRSQLGSVPTGVFAGGGPAEYSHARLRNGFTGAAGAMATGPAASSLAGRVAFALGLSGPAVSVDSASSSMLTAVHLACQALRRGECDLALAGTCSLLLSPLGFTMLDAAGMLSASGQSLPFTASADGYLRSEGCGVVVLKRYRDAVADGDQPYAVVRGSAVHADAGRPALTIATSVTYQVAIERALREAGTDPRDVRFVEAQANGLKIGQVIEAEATAAACRPQGRDTTANPLYLGSCKATFGYLECASGAPSLLKTALAVAHGEIPPQPGAADLDPDIAWSRLGLRCPEKPVPWGDGQRVAGVTGVGFSGTAVHVVLENVPGGHAADAQERHEAAPPLTLSAHTPRALARTAARLREHLAARTDWDCATVCKTLAWGRETLPVQFSAPGTDRTELLAALAAAAGGHVGRWPHGRDAAPAPSPPPPGFRAQLCRLPGLVLDGQSYWPDENRWM